MQTAHSHCMLSKSGHATLSSMGMAVLNGQLLLITGLLRSSKSVLVSEVVSYIEID